MFFKEWCLSQYGIDSISEGKVINRIIVPLIPGMEPQFDPLMYVCGATLTTHQGKKGLTFTRANYLYCLERMEVQSMLRNPETFDKDDFAIHLHDYFHRFGFDLDKIEQYRTLPNIHLTFSNEEAKNKFLKVFERKKPTTSYDDINQRETIAISATFLNDLYTAYSRSSVANHLSLKSAKQQKLQLQKLIEQMTTSPMKRLLNTAQKLALDYDNGGHLGITSKEACAAYATSLKIYAELHRSALSPDNFHALYTAATLLVAHDKAGNPQQCLQLDASFVQYIQYTLYDGYLVSISEKPRAHDNPLLSGLPAAVQEKILNAIETHTADLLYGNAKAKYGEDVYFSAARFLPDQEKNSGTDEIIFQGGEMRGHSIVFRLIKIGIMENGLQATHGEIPHHYEYYKVVNNLGENGHDKVRSTKTCLGTYVTKLQVINLNPYTHPEEYQLAMEKTLKELIMTERLLRLYRKPKADDYDSDFSKPGSAEGEEWQRLYDINQRLSGVPYCGTLSYTVPDNRNPTIKRRCTVSNQRGYIQEGGSCSIFTIKSLIDSVLGHELTTLHLHFMQQVNAAGYLRKLQARNVFLDNKIDRLSPMVIQGSRDEIRVWLEKFREFLTTDDTCHDLFVSSSFNAEQGKIILSTPYLKRSWAEFSKDWYQPKKAEHKAEYPCGFFKKAKNSTGVDTPDSDSVNQPSVFQ